MSKPLHQRKPKGSGKGTNVTGKEEHATRKQAQRKAELLARMRARNRKQQQERGVREPASPESPR